MDSDIAWVAPFPAHYTRALHVTMEERWPGTFTFLYVCRPGRRGRSYEIGDLPGSSVVIDEGSAWAGIAYISRTLSELAPETVLVNGHAPTPIGWAILWTLFRQKKLVYRSDTSLMDVVRHRSWWRKLFHRILGQTLLGRASALLPIGSQNRQYYRWAIGRDLPSQEQIRVPNPHTMSGSPRQEERVRSSAHAEDEAVTFLYLGRLAPEKGVDRLIRAAALLESRTADWCLRVVGSGPEGSALATLARRLELNGRVEFPGEIASGARARVFAEADVLVLPSHQESWGLVVNEALSAGLPVIAPYWVGAAADLLVDGYDGVVLPSNDPRAIATAMASLVEEPDRIPAMGERGRELVEAGGWTLEGALDGVERLLHALR